MTLTAHGPGPARSRPARLAGDVRAQLYQAIADLAETALWLPGRYVSEHDRAADILARISGDLARAATMLRGWPAYPPDWPAHSYVAATALAAAQAREPDLGAWLAAMLATVPRGEGRRLAAALAQDPGRAPGSSQ
jgi:hypothetical protein